MRTPDASDNTWCLARIWHELAAVAPDRVAVIENDEPTTFATFDERASRLAGFLARNGLRPGRQVALLLPNSVAYLEGFFAALKLGSAPVNVNHRYVGGEIAYLLDDADADALVYHARFAAAVSDALDRLDRSAPVCVEVGGDTTPLVEGALALDDVIAIGEPSAVDHTPSEDDLVLLYTGGTTGFPKGVMWRNADLYRALWESSRPGKPMTDPVDAVRAGKRAATTLPACPLMHGTGLFASINTLCGGGTVVVVDTPKLDPIALWDAVERHAVAQLIIVGDAFARPLLAALDAEAERWDLGCLKAISSSGALWSPSTKDGLLRHLPDVVLVDSLGASEGIMSRSVTDRTQRPAAATFVRNERLTVVADDGTEIEPGSGRQGLLAVGGALPLGYYKDPEKTAATFREINGKRYSIPGDHATVEADGTIRLLGRGSQCINSGGEKIYPEEVDAVLKAHPDVVDALTVGLPDERWGERVVAAVQLRSEATVSTSELERHCRTRLAPYKCPKDIVLLDDLGRAPNGKADYSGLKQRLRAHFSGAMRSATENVSRSSSWPHDV